MCSFTPILLSTCLIFSIIPLSSSRRSGSLHDRLSKCPLNFSTSDASSEYSFDILSKLGMDMMVKQTNSRLKVVTGSNKHQKAFHVDRLSLLRMRTQDIFGLKLPPQFSFSTTFRISPDFMHTPWSILYVEDSHGRMQLGVQMSGEKQVIKVRLLNTVKMSIQNIDFSLDNVFFSNFFDGGWHKLAVSFTPSRIEVFVDCVKVGSAYPHNTNLTHVDTQGLVYMGRKTDGHGVEFDLQWAMLHCDAKIPSVEKCTDINIKPKSLLVSKLPPPLNEYEDEDVEEEENKFLKNRKNNILKKIINKNLEKNLEKLTNINKYNDKNAFNNDVRRHNKKHAVKNQMLNDKKKEKKKILKSKKHKHKSVQKYLKKKNHKKKSVKTKKTAMRPLEQGLSLTEIYKPPSIPSHLSNPQPTYKQPYYPHPQAYYLNHPHHHFSHHQSHLYPQPHPSSPNHHHSSPHYYPQPHPQPPSSFNPYPRTQAAQQTHQQDIDTRMVGDSNYYYDQRPSFRGEPGYRGIYGERLYQGGSGRESGKDGAEGSPGSKGISGEPGVSGRPGNPGPPGQPGSTGPQGSQGLRGQPGMPGNPGTAARMHTTSEVKEICNFVLQERMLEISYNLEGPPGPPGVGRPGKQGPTGKQGIPGDPGGAGIQGDRGMVGPMGPSGLNGLPGPKGDTGERGEVGECESYDSPQEGRPGPPGPAGQQGIGNPGTQGRRGEPGMPGQPGSNGDRGIRGPAGVCNCQDYMHPFESEALNVQSRRKRSVKLTKTGT